MAKRPVSPPLIAPLLLLASCFTTHFHLIAPSDPLRYTTATPRDGWARPGFDDSGWQLLPGAGSIGPLSDGMVVCARRQFDLGPEAAQYRKLELSVDTQGAWIAYLNGTQVAAGDGQVAPITLTPANGLLTATGDVLAFELHPPPGAGDVSIQPELDGAPEVALSSAPQIVRGPWLTATGETGATIVWETDRPAASRAIVDGRVLDGGAGTHHQVRVDGLEPARAYAYHVECGAEKTDEGRLTTAPRPGEPVRFVVYGDDRTDGDAHREVVDAIAGESPDFVVNTGDMVGTNNDDEWQSFFTIEYPLLRDVPLFPAVGNHEASTPGGEPHVAELFPEPGAQTVGGGHVYGVDFGDVHLAVLDSNGDLHPQGAWLDQDLSAAEARGARHLFVVLHWGPFSSGTTPLHGSNDDARQAIVPVAEVHHVDAIFEGHDHFYERGRSGSLTYFVSGGGGAPLGSPGRIRETQAARAVHHYLVVDVSGASASVTAKDSTGVPFDSVVLTR